MLKTQYRCVTFATALISSAKRLRNFRRTLGSFLHKRQEICEGGGACCYTRSRLQPELHPCLRAPETLPELGLFEGVHGATNHCQPQGLTTLEEEGGDLKILPATVYYKMLHCQTNNVL